MRYRIIGWIAISRMNPKTFGGSDARCKVYSSKAMAVNAMKGRRRRTDDHVHDLWEFQPVFIKYATPKDREIKE
jgi:hypothetical protein